MPKLYDLDVDQHLHDSVTITPEALNEEFVRVPADLAYWNARYVDVLRAKLLAEAGLEREEARLTIAWREKMVAGGLKPTESMVEAKVQTDDAYHAARVAQVEAEVEWARIKGTLSAIHAKKEALISLGAQLRQEMQDDPQVRERARAHRERA